MSVEVAVEGLRKYFESVGMELIDAKLEPADGFFRGTAKAVAKGVEGATEVEYEVLVEPSGSVSSVVAKA